MQIQFKGNAQCTHRWTFIFHYSPFLLKWILLAGVNTRPNDGHKCLKFELTDTYMTRAQSDTTRISKKFVLVNKRRCRKNFCPPHVNTKTHTQ